MQYPGSSEEALVDATAHYVQTVKDPKVGTPFVHSLYFVTHRQTLTLALLVIFTYIFSSFLSIPATSQSLTPQFYTSVPAIPGPGNNSGTGQIFGASALSGPPEYINAFRHYKNLSMNILPSGQVVLSTLAFTPIPETQVKMGRRMGGNAIDPPLGSYVAVQLQTQFAQGVKVVPAAVEDGRLLFFEQYVPFSFRLFVLSKIPGISYRNECDQKQLCSRHTADANF